MSDDGGMTSARSPFDPKELRARRLADVLHRAVRVSDIEVPITLAREVLTVLPELHELDELAKRQARLEAIADALDVQETLSPSAAAVPEPLRPGMTVVDALRAETAIVLAAARPVGARHEEGYRAGFAAFEERTSTLIAALPTHVATMRLDRGGDGEGTVTDRDIPLPSAPCRTRPAPRAVPVDHDARQRRHRRILDVASVLLRFSGYYVARRDLGSIASELIDALPELEEIDRVRNHVLSLAVQVGRRRAWLAKQRASMGLSEAVVLWRTALARELRSVAGFVAVDSVGVGSDFAAGFDSACHRIAQMLRDRADAIDVIKP